MPNAMEIDDAAAHTGRMARAHGTWSTPRGQPSSRGGRPGGGRAGGAISAVRIHQASRGEGYRDARSTRFRSTGDPALVISRALAARDGGGPAPGKSSAPRDMRSAGDANGRARPILGDPAAVLHPVAVRRYLEIIAEAEGKPGKRRCAGPVAMTDRHPIAGGEDVLEGRCWVGNKPRGTHRTHWRTHQRRGSAGKWLDVSGANAAM